MGECRVVYVSEEMPSLTFVWGGNYIDVKPTDGHRITENGSEGSDAMACINVFDNPKLNATSCDLYEFERVCDAYIAADDDESEDDES